MDEATAERRPGRVLGVALAAVVALGAAAILLGALVWPGGPGAGPHTVTGPVAGRQNAVFELDDPTAAVRMRAVPLGGDLYRITGSASAGVTPRVRRNGGEVRLSLDSGGQVRAAAVDVALNSGVAWTLRVNAGTRQTVVDMTGGKLDRIDLGGGSDQVEIALPRPTGVVPVRLTAGVDRLEVRLPARTPARVGFGAGAGAVDLDGTVRQGVARGQSFTAYGWGQTGTGIDIQAEAGVGSATVTHY